MVMVEVVFLFYYLLAQSYRCVVIWTPLAVRVDRFSRTEAPRRAGLTLVWVCFQRVGEKFGFFPAVRVLVMEQFPVLGQTALCPA